jgi:hypothetical protein
MLSCFKLNCNKISISFLINCTFKSLDFNGYGYLLAIEKKFEKHGKELAKSFNLSEIDGIVCVSADRVLVEVCSIPMETDYEICMPVISFLLSKVRTLF